MYIYIYIYIYTHTYIYIQVYLIKVILESIPINSTNQITDQNNIYKQSSGEI